MLMGFSAGSELEWAVFWWKYFRNCHIKS